MRWFTVYFLGLFLIGLSVSAIPLCDYRSPQTDLSDLGISFSYNYHNDPYGISDQDRNYGQLKADYSRLFDVPDFGFGISVDADMTISVLRLSSYLIAAEGNLKRYVAPDAAYFGFAGVSGKSASSYDALRLAVSVGVGYGRFADITPLAKATKIDDYLFGVKSIADHLDDLDLEAIAFEIDSINTYDSLADLLAVVQEIVEESGLAKAGGLDALDIYEVGIIIADDDHPRYCGGDAKIGFEYVLLDPSGGLGELLATAAFNYALATTPQAQFLAQGTVSGSSDILNTHQIEIRLGCDYVLTDKVGLASSYSFAREAWDGVPTDTHTVSVKAELSPIETAQVALELELSHEPYFLEWKTDVTLTMSMDLL